MLDTPHACTCIAPVSLTLPFLSVDRMYPHFSGHKFLGGTRSEHDDEVEHFISYHAGVSVEGGMEMAEK